MLQSSRSSATLTRKIHGATDHSSPRKRRIRCSTLLPFCFGILATILGVLMYVAFNLGEDGSIRIRHISAKNVESKFRLVVERPETKEEANHEHAADSQKRTSGDMNRETTLRGQQHLNNNKDDVAEKQHTNFVQAPDRQHHWEKLSSPQTRTWLPASIWQHMVYLATIAEKKCQQMANLLTCLRTLILAKRLEAMKDGGIFKHTSAIRVRILIHLPFMLTRWPKKRWLPTIGYDVPKSFALRYKTEIKVRQRAVKNIIPKDTSFVAKSSHFSAAKGVIIVECCKGNQHQQVGRMLSSTFSGSAF